MTLNEIQVYLHMHTKLHETYRQQREMYMKLAHMLKSIADEKCPDPDILINERTMMRDMVRWARQTNKHVAFHCRQRDFWQAKLQEWRDTLTNLESEDPYVT